MYIWYIYDCRIIYVESSFDSNSACVCSTIVFLTCWYRLPNQSTHVCFREKYTLEQDIGDTEEAIRQKSAEVQVRAVRPQGLMNEPCRTDLLFWQEMQNDLDRETAALQELESQKQDAQDRLEEMDQQKRKLEDMLNEIRMKCQEESHMVIMRGNEGCGRSPKH